MWLQSSAKRFSSTALGAKDKNSLLVGVTTVFSCTRLMIKLRRRDSTNSDTLSR